jgi:uncharacterized protein (TIGR03067 family)
VEAVVRGGRPDPAGRGVVVTFTPDGQMVVRNPGNDPVAFPVAADPKKDPAELDFLPRPGVTDPPDRAIFKVEGDTLTICAGKQERPAKFESPAGTAVTLMTLKRAAKK